MKDQEERAILETLDAAVRAALAAGGIAEIVDRVQAELRRSPAEAMAWEPIPLELYGGDLPGDVRSSWVFVLRAGAVTGAERHPNSRQRMMTYRGGGDFQTQPGEDWISHHLHGDVAAPLEERWISIPPSVWHQGVVGDRDWAVVSFQTATVEELIEERPGEGGTVHARTYVDEHES